MSTFKAGIVSAVLVFALSAAGQSQKTWKDQAEFDLYQGIKADIAASDFTKMLADAGTWKQRYPNSEWANERELLFVQGYFQTRQYPRVLDTAADLLAKDYEGGLSGPTDAANLLFMTALAIQQIPDATSEQLAIGEKAARALAAYDKIPAGVKPEDWEKSKAQMAAAARAALLFVALAPGTQALKKKDCAEAESRLKLALEDRPQSAQAAALFGQAELCLYKAEPEKISIALYEYARAASLDPAQSMVDPKWQQQIESQLEDIFRQYHGQDAEGLKQLKAEAVKTPLPPDGFQVKSKAELDRDAQVEFERTHPELTLWRNIKTQLAGPDGAQYFESNVKDALLPQLLGTLVEAKPACRPTELLVALSSGDGPPEVALRLEKPLAGAPELHGELRWTGVARQISQDPFLLTMEAEPDKIDGLKISACTAPAAKKSPAKRSQ